MSRTNKDIRRYKTVRFWDEYWEDRRKHCGSWWYLGTETVDKELSVFVSKNKEFKSSQQLYTDYSSAPSWWTRLFSNIPKKREEKMLVNKILKDHEIADSLVFPLARKPFSYYW